MNHNAKHWVSITAGILCLASHANATSLGNEKYTYDASGNIVEKSIDGKITKMSFDKSNRVTNRRSPGQVEKSLSYDAAGRPVGESASNSGSTRTVSYGYGDKVLHVRNGAGNKGFYYNAEGQLVGEEGAGKVSTYIWDGNVLAADGARTFTNESHVTGGVPLLESGSEIVVSDYLGNTLACGEEKFHHSAFGEGLEAGRFTGKPFVESLEGYVFKNRLYSAEAGRWNTFDPQGFPDGLNNSTYVNNRPLELCDPLGLTGCSAHQLIEWEYPNITATGSPAAGGTYTIKLKVTFYTNFSTAPTITNVQPSGSAGTGISIQGPTAVVSQNFTAVAPQNCNGTATYEYRHWASGKIMGQCDFVETSTSTYTPGQGDIVLSSKTTHHEK